MKIRPITICLITHQDRMLVFEGHKDDGSVYYRPLGGGIEFGEKAVDAAVREVEEELCITPHAPEEMGILRFAFVDGLHLHCTVFRSEDFDGDPTETREAKPEWFDLEAIPYERMWEDDIHWLPRMLGGEKFAGRFAFDDDKMLSMEVEFAGD